MSSEVGDVEVVDHALGQTSCDGGCRTLVPEELEEREVEAEGLDEAECGPFCRYRRGRWNHGIQVEGRKEQARPLGRGGGEDMEALALGRYGSVRGGGGGGARWWGRCHLVTCSGRLRHRSSGVGFGVDKWRWRWEWVSK